MVAYFAPLALLPEGWAHAVRIEVDGLGNLVSVTPNAAAVGAERLTGPVLPGMPNAHCHAFQRALAGMTQRLQPGEASFWTWRETMYRFLERLDPDDVQAIAAQLYVELLKGGYTSVVEFHYLHHAPGGLPYDEPGVMARAIDDAADEAGIGLTLLPVIYMRGGFDGSALAGGQLRFRLDPEAALALVTDLAASFASRPDRRVGLAPHSLRAVPGEALAAGVAAAQRRDAQAPIHIHVAEQVREVHACLEAHGCRPLQLLCELVEIDDRWTIIHATHLDDPEVTLLAQARAVAGLCPTTEADLGDGLFRLADHVALGGRIAIGSDSNVGTVAADELRLLEYGQRLFHLRRLVGATPAQPSCGEHLWRAALLGGAQAAARRVGALVAGMRADLLVLDAHSPDLRLGHPEPLLDRVIFGPRVLPVRDVMVGGHWCVRAGHHRREAEIATRYVKRLARLLG